MKTIDALQGSPEWLEARAKAFTASEAPAMMGVSKHLKRSELLKQKATGLTPEVSSGLQKRFDDGHAAEAAARPMIEGILGAELFPVTGQIMVDGIEHPILASFDGLTMMGDIGWESKLWNQELAKAIEFGEVDAHYFWQLEQQLLVSGADKIFFTTTDGTPENTKGMWYEAVPGRRERLIAGWKLFEEDLAKYEHKEAPAPAPVAAAVEALPMVSVQVTGSIKVAENFDVFEKAVKKFLKETLILKPATDQDFADLDKQIKAMKEAESMIEAAKGNMLAQVESVATADRRMGTLKELIRSNRLMAEKLLSSEKEARREKLVADARFEIEAYIMEMNTRLGGNYLPPATIGAFVQAIKGLKSLESMKEKLDNAMRDAKLEAAELVTLIESNKQIAEDMTLVPDFAKICTKAHDDFKNEYAARAAAREQRIAADKKAEEERTAKAVADALEAERMAEAKRAAKAATPAPVEKVEPIKPEEKAAVVVQHEDEIAAFMKARDFGKDANKIRAVLVEFVAFQATYKGKAK